MFDLDSYYFPEPRGKRRLQRLELPFTMGREEAGTFLARLQNRVSYTDLILLQPESTNLLG